LAASAASLISAFSSRFPDRGELQVNCRSIAGVVMNEEKIVSALTSIASAIEDLAEEVEALTRIMVRLTFVDYGVHEENNKPLNLRVYINSD
jgi:hypothetical protein